MTKSEMWNVWKAGGTITVRRIPIREVLEKVPGESWAEKARKLRVPRQVVSMWLSGKGRPGWKNARKLEKITGIPAAEIVGKVVRTEG